MTSFVETIQERTQKIQSVLCVGLDTSLSKTPDVLQRDENPQLAWNRAIIDATHDLACCYKPNLAFYLIHGPNGIETLKETIRYAHSYNVPVILDAKFGDIGHTAQYYARSAFETLEADSVTLNPYMGEESIAPFRKFKNRCSFILCLTSNVSRLDFQTLSTPYDELVETPLFHRVAKKIKEWNTNQNLAAVVGATAPEELSQVREFLDTDMPILCPGVGVQGGDLEEVLWAGYT
ncbi:MAG: orotidine-5'-phosphate decarboxylase, partial [Candidatus Hinthialibacter sp.]